ncbi:MAG: DUF992 domain-containing protein [Dongiaceae bacterium]
MVTTTKQWLLVGTLAAAIAGASAESVAADGVKAGFLRCNVDAGVSFLFGSSRDIQCSYTPHGGKRTDYYSGSIDSFGVDIGYRENGVLIWGVIAPASDVGHGSLAGKYSGASAEAAAGYGLGANALIGGGSKSIALQPLSIEGTEGLNIAAGVSTLTLNAR